MNIYKVTPVGPYNRRIEKALRDAGALRTPAGDFYVQAARPPKVWGCRARKVTPKPGAVVIQTPQDWDKWLGDTFGF